MLAQDGGMLSLAYAAAHGGVSGILRDMSVTQQSTAHKRALAALSYVSVALAALWPRIADLGRFVTVDEAAYWITRSHSFLEALRSGDFAATVLSAHPGVTTMWLGAAGIVLQGWLTAAGLLPGVTFATALSLLQLPVALAHSSCILAGYWLLRRLWPALALPAALLWAADPFLIAYSRVLHVDGLAASFGAVSLLTALYSQQTPRRRLAWALSGVCAGLAVLSKSPALALAPAIGILALWYAWRPLKMAEVPSEAPAGLVGALRIALPDIAIWSGGLALTIVALWPALWVAPTAVVDQLRFGVEVEGGQPHMLGNFFLGRPDPAPGALFYPVALALRSTPISLAGVLLLPLVWRRFDARQRRMLALFALAALMFVVALSIFPKKFNRYLVPAFPFVDILAAAGLWSIINGIWEWLKSRSARYRRLAALDSLVLAVVGILALANAWSWHPYAIAAYNQALGGARTGANTFLTGWGEGNEQVAAWLAARPDIRGVITVAPNPSVIQPYMPAGAQVSRPRAGELPADAGYVVVDIRQVQDGELPPPFDAFYRRVPPLFTARIHGVEYAWIYQAPPHVAQAVGASFGSTLLLYGYDLAEPPARGAALAVRLAFFVRETPPPGLVLFAHLIAEDGARVAQVDLPLPVAEWTAGGYARQELPLALPADLPAGRYRLYVGLYDSASGARLPLSGVAPADPAISGPDAAELLSFEVAK